MVKRYIPISIEDTGFSRLLFALTTFKKPRQRVDFYALLKIRPTQKANGNVTRIFTWNKHEFSMPQQHLCGWVMLILMSFVSACTPIKSSIENQYKIISFSTKNAKNIKNNKSILVAQSDAMAGYQTEQMLYTDRLYQLNAFAHSAWISPPANMLTPLMVQSLQHSHYFHAVATGPYADKTDYRLDTELLNLEQNFLVKPSRLEFKVQVVLTRVTDNKVLASRTFMEQIPCLTDTPYGGVIATNRATQAFTAKLTPYIIQQVEQDKL